MRLYTPTLRAQMPCSYKNSDVSHSQNFTLTVGVEFGTNGGVICVLELSRIIETHDYKSTWNIGILLEKDTEQDSASVRCCLGGMRAKV